MKKQIIKFANNKTSEIKYIVVSEVERYYINEEGKWFEAS